MEDEVLEQEQVVETPVETVVEPEPQPAPEPLKINTHGQWELLEHFMQQELEVGKTYRINVAGHCQFMISADKPTVGMATNQITYTKQEGQNLWIKTGE